MKGQRQTSGKPDEGLSSGRRGGGNSGILTNALKASQTNTFLIEERALAVGPLHCVEGFCQQTKRIREQSFGAIQAYI